MTTVDTPSEASENEPVEPLRRWKWVWRAVRLAVLVLVFWGILRAAEKGVADIRERGLQLHQLRIGWLVAAGGLYALGMLPSGWFWHRTLCAMGQQPLWRDSIPAYYVSQFGKYIPGKAMVVVLRAELVCSGQVSRAVAATAVFIETLTMMAVGSLVAAVLILLTIRDQRLLVLAAALLLAAGIPTLPPVFRRLVRWLQIRRAAAHIESALEGLTMPLLLTGWLGMAGGWLLFGLSLWATVCALPDLAVTPLQALYYWPSWTACVALAVVAGFVSFLPGGLGVREYVLMAIIGRMPAFGPGVAVVSAVLLRLVWLATELLCGSSLWLTTRRRR